MENNRLWVLLGKKINGEASCEELAELKILLDNDPSNLPNIQILEAFIKLPINSTVEPGIENNWNQLSSNILLQQVTKRENATIKKTFFLHHFKLIAAAACIIFSLSLGSYFFYTNQDTVEKDLNIPPQNEVATKAGSRTNIVLPDGTKVWLNAGSVINYKKDFLSNRQVTLTGEAFFDVAHQTKNPFIVHCININIKVLGTAFNVKAYPLDSKVETSLLRGLIELTTDKDPERKFLLRPNEKITITNNKNSTDKPLRKEEAATQKDAYTIGALTTNSKLKIPEEIAWMQEKLVFTGESFKSLARRMERWYGVEIEITDPKVEELKFTGVFDSLNIVQAIQTLEFSCNNKFLYNINKNKIIIKPKQ